MRYLIVIFLVTISINIGAQTEPGTIVVRKYDPGDTKTLMRELPTYRPWFCRGVIRFECVSTYRVSLLLGTAADKGMHYMAGFYLLNETNRNRTGVYFLWSAQGAISSLNGSFQKNLVDRNRLDLSLGMQCGLTMRERGGITYQPYIGLMIPELSERWQLNAGYQWNKMFNSEINAPQNAVRLSLWFYL